MICRRRALPGFEAIHGSVAEVVKTFGDFACRTKLLTSSATGDSGMRSLGEEQPPQRMKKPRPLGADEVSMIKRWLAKPTGSALPRWFRPNRVFPSHPINRNYLRFQESR